MDINVLRHPKEKFYRSLSILFGALIWILLLVGTVGSILLILLPLALSLWIAGKFFQASIYGNAVHVNSQQYAELSRMCNEVASELNLTDVPRTFVVNSQGMINALAVKFLQDRYTLLYSDLVDLLWDDEGKKRLRMVIAHELAHHAAGHINFWVNIVIKPAMLIPFLGTAYSRACELTADRIAAEVVQDEKACVEALIALTSGSANLIPHTNIQAFENQEHEVPKFFGFLQEIFATHPRMTKRVIAIQQHFRNGDISVRTASSFA